MLIIHHQLYKSQAKELCDIRKQNLSIYMKEIDSTISYNSIKKYIIEHLNLVEYVCLIGNEKEVRPLYLPIKNTGGNSETAASDLSFGIFENEIKLMIGRITSGEAKTDQERKSNVQNQIDKIRTYQEIYDSAECPNWINNIMGIGSGEGGGWDGLGLLDENGEPMADRDFIRQELLLFKNINYDIKGYFDPYDNYRSQPSGSELVGQGFSDGSSLVCYVGHGTEEAITTSNFSVNDVNNLNENSENGMYPFCIFVACSVGSFDENEISLTESLQIKKRGGSICSCGSTILQEWLPPMHALKIMLETVRTYVANNTNERKEHITCGQIFYKGVKEMYDVKSKAVDRNGALTWCFMGDPSTPFNTPCRPTLNNLEKSSSTEQFNNLQNEQENEITSSPKMSRYLLAGAAVMYLAMMSAVYIAHRKKVKKK
tara:strand:- start:3727 stop:5013 length:1287 start_codon:yes stop_codon:yes gene_type:complete